MGFWGTGMGFWGKVKVFGESFTYPRLLRSQLRTSLGDYIVTVVGAANCQQNPAQAVKLSASIYGAPNVGLSSVLVIR